MTTSQRRLASFIQTFITETEPYASPTIFRRWIGIGLIAAALRQNCWVKTASRLFPNMYIFLVAHPGVGKTRAINYGREVCLEAGIRLAPVSVTFASLVDALHHATHEVIRQPQGKITYNSILITADELGAFIHKYDNEMMAGLTAFYDPTPYQQKRRTGGADGQGIELEIKSPQLNIITGSTPQTLMSFLPETAWGQGFTSRMVLIFSDQRLIIDDFADHGVSRMADLVHDLKHISNLFGQFTVDPTYRAAVNHWRDAGEPPVPGHPRLVHYATRRRVHLYKLSMVASVDRSDDLILTEADFLTALGWLSHAERFMPDIFKAGAVNADSQAMNDILHWIRVTDPGDPFPGVSESAIIKYASDHVPIHTIPRLLEILQNSGQIKEVRRSKHTLAKYYSIVVDPDSTPT